MSISRDVASTPKAKTKTPQPLSAVQRTNSQEEVQKRERGRPPTTREYVGLAKAKRQLIEAERELIEDFESIRVGTRASDSVQLSQNARKANTSGVQTMVPFVSRDMPSAQIVEQADKLAASVRRLATTSKRLKGTFVKQFKEAAFGLEETVHLLAGRMDSNDEVHRLGATNRRLSADVAEMRDTISSLKGDKEAVQRKLDSVVTENKGLRAEIEKLHQELGDMRKDFMSLRMVRLEEAKKKRKPGTRPTVSPSASRGGGSGGSVRSSPEPPYPPTPPAGPRKAVRSPQPGRSSLFQCDSDTRSKGTFPGVRDYPAPPRTEKLRDPGTLKEWERRIMNGVREQLSKFWKSIEQRHLRTPLGSSTTLPKVAPRRPVSEGMMLPKRRVHRTRDPPSLVSPLVPPLRQNPLPLKKNGRERKRRERKRKRRKRRRRRRRRARKTKAETDL